ncbi:Txe/YoeB family addiction module toxin [Devosia sp. ZB163]|uniref:Txe/YoeB family addiction module toxin n=1 Tax=Devosia sp. ZB163 TaxID=3025938 RepID=UPI0023625243|nr:Txe/YoeB family addiction module toxin [Devosia sp. ZB163]MDC9825004.1 Txe/YoeB family addiction module toxin [Devosia sp. ZB163]
MRLVFTERGWDEYQHWQQSDPRILRKLNALLKECSRTPYEGTGKPEALRDDFSGWWSRRITEEHRLVYRAEGDNLIIAQCRYHYHK